MIQEITKAKNVQPNLNVVRFIPLNEPNNRDQGIFWLNDEQGKLLTPNFLDIERED